MKASKSFDIKNVLVYLIMILLLFIIALPPIFRMVFKETTPNIEMPTDTATALICTRQAVVEPITYTIRVTTNYIGTTLSKVSFQYQRSTMLNPAPVNDIETEMQTMKANPAFTVSEETNGLKLVVTPATVAADTTGTLQSTYFNDLATQNAYFSQNGYVCQTITS